MQKMLISVYFLALIALLSGCAMPAPLPTAQIPTAISASPTAMILPTSAATASEAPPGQVPSAIDTMPVSTPEPVLRFTDTPEASGTSPESQNVYLDDRSTPTGIILSLFNAINRKEYARAYSYWENSGSSSNVPSFDQFAKGYQETDSVEVSIGVVGADVGAGQLYYNVPIVLQVQMTTGKAQIFSGCYTLHLARPEIQAAPPYHPLSIASAMVNQQQNSPNTDDLLSAACQGPNFRQTTPVNPPLVTDPGNVGAANYLDDRSDPVTLLRSLFNAINRKEFARAYSYWETPGTSQNVPPFTQFQQGYQDTASVEPTFGTPRTGAAAGNLYYSVPTALKVQTTGGTIQTFVGCYVLHLGQPANQTTPPFDPMAIQSAQVKAVDNGTDLNNLMGTVCQNIP